MSGTPRRQRRPSNRLTSPSMSNTGLFLIALTVLPMTGLAAWLWLAISSTTEDLRCFAGYDGMHFDD